MSETTSTSPAPRDLLSLMSAALPEMISELERAAPGTLDRPGLPPRAEQIADLIVGDVVRLVRLGTRAELTEAAAVMSEAIVSDAADLLEATAPEALRHLDAAAITLAAAVSPSSNGGEVAVLRSWNGLARDILTKVATKADGAIGRAELRKKFGVSQSHLSHVLADLESAGLIDRVRHGKHVTVHLGSTAYLQHVQEQIDRQGDDERRRIERMIRTVLEAAIAGHEVPEEDLAGDAADTLAKLAESVKAFRRDASGADLSIESVAIEGTLAVVSVRVTGVLTTGRAALRRVNTEVTWQVKLQEDRIVDVGPLAECDEWLGPELSGHRPDPADALAGDEFATVRMTVDQHGETLFRAASFASPFYEFASPHHGHLAPRGTTDKETIVSLLESETLIKLIDGIERDTDNTALSQR